MFADLPAASVLANEQQRYPYRDSHCRPLRQCEIGNEQLIAAFLAAAPGWADTLMRTRDHLVGRFGLKTGGQRGEMPKPPFRVGQQLGVFRILHLAPAEVILGEDDRHLDFRLSLRVESSQLRITTLVRPHNIFGVLYLVCVLPFHHAIAAVMATRMARTLKDRAPA